MRNSQLSLLISSMFCCASFVAQGVSALLALSLAVIWAVLHVMQCYELKADEAFVRNPRNDGGSTR